ncbi:hypothetical protein E0H73_30825 [Kribbella pittospori]|uniref:DUF892 family protein n=1 Tax=Kribbella pittospori TaxID=722689 RepID=A0A4R0KBN7_9ACTN|nr:hypothetical protein [Kribbella pittospori]TCC57751.1 hypothetical protein E0H73_30825 [Kribbella pittospori]
MKNKVGLALAELHRAENDLAAGLLQISDRHKADHDIFYLGRDLATWSQEHVRRLAEYGKAYDLDLDPTTVRKTGAEPSGGSHDPALLLLKDLRAIHCQAAGVSLDWEILAQTAQALKDTDLLALAQSCHPQTLRQLRWTNATLKTNAPQIMVTP